MRLAKREKIFATVASLAFVSFLLSQFIIFPFLTQMKRVQKSISIQKKSLKEITVLRAEYLAQMRMIKETDKNISARDRNFTLFSFLEEAAGKAQIKPHIKYMKPSDFQVAGPYTGSIVELKLEDLTLKQLVNYLYCIESPAKIISIKRMSIRKQKETSGYLDALLEVVTIHKT